MSTEIFKPAPGRWVEITLEDGRVYRVLRDLVARNRAEYYVKRDPSTNYEAEYNYLMEMNTDADDEVNDWLFNNMDWYELNPVFVRHNLAPISELGVDSVNYITVPDHLCEPGV